MAFNLTVLSNLLGTPLEPDFTGVDLLIEDVGEHLYRIDRTMFHVTASANVRKAARHPARTGRRHPRQRPRFRRATKCAIVEDWCAPFGHPVSAAARTSATTRRTRSCRSARENR